METISNIASTATTTVSNLIYGDQTKNNEAASKETVPGDQTMNNETASKEPVSGEQGKGTATEPFDQGNARE